MRGNLGALCGLQWLEVVSLSYNSIAGELPPCLNAMVGMTSLDVGYNLIDGTTPDAVCGMVATDSVERSPRALEMI